MSVHDISPFVGRDQYHSGAHFNQRNLLQGNKHSIFIYSQFNDN